MNKERTLEIPCTYQGGKQRLARQIVDIIFEQNSITEDTKFYDLCCGSGAITLELINRDVHPSNIIMVDKGCMGYFWNSIANDEFMLDKFKDRISLLPEIHNYQSYLKDLTSSYVDYEHLEYDYLLIQAGSFGGKQIWIEEDKWKNNSFRNYWTPTETSNRKSPVNPMMPMPDTLYKRVEDIVFVMSGIINALNCDVLDVMPVENSIVYIDPPYENTTKYGYSFDYMEYVNKIKGNGRKIYLSEGKKISSDSILLSTGRLKGYISGNTKKKPIEEWLNIF